MVWVATALVAVALVAMDLTRYCAMVDDTHLVYLTTPRLVE
jgi:hypothetical protein